MHLQLIYTILRTFSEGKNATPRSVLEGASHLRAIRNAAIYIGLPESIGGFLTGEKPVKKNTVSLK